MLLPPMPVICFERKRILEQREEPVQNWGKKVILDSSVDANLKDLLVKS
jgi:hypothetical protein